MQNNRDIERLLEETPKPNVNEGPHRLKLKYSLINQMRKETVPMRTWRRTLVWAACLVLIASLAGWAGQKAYKKFTVVDGDDITVSEEAFENPDGSTGMFIHSQSRRVEMSSDDPRYTEEKAREQYEEIQKLVSEGKYELLEVKQTDYGDVYIYKFKLSDGETVAWGTRKPIGSPDEDVIKYQEIKELFAQGKVELIEEKELDSGKKMYLYKITRSDGTSFTFGSDTPLEPEK